MADSVRAVVRGWVVAPGRGAEQAAEVAPLAPVRVVLALSGGRATVVDDSGAVVDEGAQERVVSGAQAQP